MLVVQRKQLRNSDKETPQDLVGVALLLQVQIAASGGFSRPYEPVFTDDFKLPLCIRFIMRLL